MKKPYDERTDLERIQSQWNKVTGLHSRKEWSAVIVRAATAAELAANLAIRKELGNRTDFDEEIVDGFLLWANGLAGKINRLLIPLSAKHEYAETVRGLQAASERINRIRNEVVHQGRFCNAEEAATTIEDARAFVEALVRVFHQEFVLDDNCSKGDPSSVA